MHVITCSAMQVVRATQAWIHSHNVSHWYACSRTFCYTSRICHTCSRIIYSTSWTYPISRHAVALSATQAPHGMPHTHACSHIIRHTGLHAVACGPICCYTCCTWHTSMHALAKSATHACMRGILCHTHNHTAQRSRTFYHNCCVCHTGMNIFAYSATHERHVATYPAHRWYLPHKHE